MTFRERDENEVTHLVTRLAALTLDVFPSTAAIVNMESNLGGSSINE